MPENTNQNQTNQTNQTSQNEPDQNRQNQTGQQNGNAPDYQDLFRQLDAILERRTDGIARSALRDNGLSDEETRDIVAAYRQERSSAAQRQSQAYETLQQENQQLRSQVLQGRIQAEAMRQAGQLGVTPETVPYLLRLADLSQAADAEGQVSAEAVTAALSKVLEDLPGLKQPQQQSRGFTPVGGSGEQSPAADENRMRAWFGLAPKK